MQVLYLPAISSTLLQLRLHRQRITYFPGLSMGHRTCHTWPGQTGFFPGNLRLLSCLLPACKVSWSDSQGAWNHDCSDLWLLCSLTLDNNSQGGPFPAGHPFSCLPELYFQALSFCMKVFTLCLPFCILEAILNKVLPSMHFSYCPGAE